MRLSVIILLLLTFSGCQKESAKQQSIPPAKYIQINLAVASSSAAAVLQFY